MEPVTELAPVHGRPAFHPGRHLPGLMRTLEPLLPLTVHRPLTTLGSPASLVHAGDYARPARQHVVRRHDHHARPTDQRNDMPRNAVKSRRQAAGYRHITGMPSTHPYWYRDTTCPEPRHVAPNHPTPAPRIPKNFPAHPSSQAATQALVGVCGAGRVFGSRVRWGRVCAGAGACARASVGGWSDVGLGDGWRLATCSRFQGREVGVPVALRGSRGRGGYFRLASLAYVELEAGPSTRVGASR